MDMEQQLDPQLAKKSLWLHQEEEEEEEVGVDLLARHSRHPTNGVGITSASTATTTASGELEPVPASADINGSTSEQSEHSDQEEVEKEDAAATAYGGHRKEEVGVENEKDEVVDEEGDGKSVYFDKLQGTESINEISEMLSEITKFPSKEINHQRVKNSEDQNIVGLSPSLVEHLHEEANTSFKHFKNETKVDANVDKVGEIEEDLMELDVERVLEKQNTHDLYCPNCNSCITKKVILVRRRPKISIRQKSKRGNKLDPIPSSSGFDGSDDTPDIYSNISPTAEPDERNNGREQEQEAFSCLSCFSLFIPIGNGCFKFFRFFRQGRQTEHAQSLQEIRQREKTQRPVEIRQRENTDTPQGVSQRENTHCPQGINLSENTQIPQEISQKEKTQSPQGISQNENTETSQKVSHNEDPQNPQKRSRDTNLSSPQHINHNEGAQKPQHINRNEDTQSPQNISHNESTPSPQDINQNESKHSPQKIPTEYSPVQADHASSVPSAAVPTPSVINKQHIDGAGIKPTEPGISNIFSSTNSSLLDKLKAESTEKKPDADMLQRNVGDNEIKDIEAGLLEPTLFPRTEVTPLSQRTQTERTGADAGEAHEWEILKSIVYGGLVESVTSVGVVSSAAGAGADTLNVLALGLANLIGGLLIICHNLRELKNDQPRGASDIEEDRYQVLLGRRQNFVLHVTVAILSFLIFGLIPPVVYGFSFRKSDDKDLKLAAVAGASLICIILLALGKGHVRKPHRTYFQTVSYYVVLGITASGISYLVGELIKKLLDQLGLFESSSTISTPFLEAAPMEVGRASY